MSKTQYYTATTIDGFIADEHDSLDWLFPVDRGVEGSGEYDRFFAEVGAMAMGSTTYRWVLDHEKVLEDPGKWSTWYGDTPCWVFTHQELPVVPGANVTFVRDAVRPVHQEMTRAAGGRNVWLVGGGDLVGQFADVGLLDELLLGMAPVTLGRGAPLLPRRLTSDRLELTGVERAGQFARLRYRVRDSPHSNI